MFKQITEGLCCQKKGQYTLTYIVYVREAFQKQRESMVFYHTPLGSPP